MSEPSRPPGHGDETMKIILAHDDGTVIDTWESSDLDDFGIFDAVAKSISMGPTKKALETKLAAMEHLIGIEDARRNR
jgi:hypothetical protein